MTMEMVRSLCILVVLFLAGPAHSHKGLPGTQGLFCVNDFVNNVSCTWNDTPLAPGVDCWIFGLKTTWIVQDISDQCVTIIRSCKVKHHRNSPPGCSFVFENYSFSFFEKMPNISLECNGTLVGNITDYEPSDHIKMNPPGVPNVSQTANDTLISWSPGSPLSSYITDITFEVQVAQKNQAWEEARIFKDLQKQEIKIPSWEAKGNCKVRVRVRPDDLSGSHWSSWSPTTSWMGSTEDLPQGQMGVLFKGGLLVVILVMSCIISSCFRRLKGKPIPNPSEYFHTLHSVHRGNLKKWLNPLSASESFFTAQTRDHISTVQVCESWDLVPSTSSSSSSSSSTSALLHCQSYPSGGSDTSGIVDNFSSSSSSCYYNMGYFMSASSSRSARTDPSPTYFTYQDDFNNLDTGHNLRVPLCPLFTTSPVYETLKREPQSPDSGFGTGKEDEEDKKDEWGMNVEGEEVSGDPQSPPLFILPLPPPPRMSPSSFAPPPLHPSSLTQKSPDSQQVEVPVAAATGSYAAWPVASTMSRSSSMPFEPCKTGYLTLKELQTTFSNKSI